MNFVSPQNNTLSVGLILGSAKLSCLKCSLEKYWLPKLQKTKVLEKYWSAWRITFKAVLFKKTTEEYTVTAINQFCFEFNVSGE